MQRVTLYANTKQHQAGMQLLGQTHSMVANHGSGHKRTAQPTEEEAGAERVKQSERARAEARTAEAHANSAALLEKSQAQGQILTPVKAGR